LGWPAKWHAWVRPRSVRESRYNLPVRESRHNLPVWESRYNLPVWESGYNLPVWESRYNRPELAKVPSRSASIPKGATIRERHYLVRLSVCNRLGRSRVVGLSCSQFLIRFRVGRRIYGDGSGLKTGAWIRLHRTLLIVPPRRRSRLFIHRPCSFTVGSVIYRVRTWVSRIKYVCDRPDGVHHFSLRSCRGAGFGGRETGIDQPGHESDQNAEFDRNKICNFWVHFGKSLQMIIKMTETRKNYSFNLVKI
jgi:hypothetical protein